MPADRGPVPRDAPGGSIRTCATSRRRCSTTTASSRSRTSRVQRRRCRPAPSSTAPGRGCSRSPTVGADNESPVEADAVARLARDHRRRRLDLDRSRRASSGPIGWADVLIVAPVQRPGRRDPAAPAAGGPGRDGRQVPGPGGADQHLLDDDLVARARAARHGLPVQPAPAQRRDVAGPMRRDRRGLAGPACGCGPGRPSRCGWPMRSAGSRSWRADGPAEPDQVRRPISSRPDPRRTHARARAQASTSAIGTCSSALWATRTSPGPKITHGVPPTLTNICMSAP